MKRTALLGFVRRRALAWLGAVLLLACGSDRLASSEIGNPPKKGTVMGVIYTEDGQPSPGTRVGLLPAHYDPVHDTGSRIWFDTTDAMGSFAIDSVDSGSYNIQALQLSARTSLLIQGVEVRSDTTVASARQYLQEPGAISILIPDSVPTKNAYVYLPGTEVHTATTSLVGESRLIYLDSVPAGLSPEITYRSSAADSGSQNRRIRLSEGVTVVPGDTVPASVFQEWAYSSRIFLNTTPAGANVITGPAFGFPLLVRLGPGASVFSSAAADGHDLRFTKADGRPLRHEIESWDRAGSQAVIWVKLDTVLADDSDQFIRMYWGNPSATQPDAKPVFDSASGYQSIWHMEALGAGNPPSFTDHSVVGNSLSAGGGLSETDLTAGPMGLGANLSGDSTTLYTSKSFDSPSVFTISLWFKTTTVSGGKLIGFGADPLMVDTSRDRHIWMDTVGMVHFGVLPIIGGKGTQKILSSSKALNDGQWHMVAGVLWSGGQVLYVDGNKAGEDPTVTTAQPYPKGYWKIGFDFKFYDWPFPPSSLYFKGTVDEGRVANKSFSREWVKLSYESQRPDSRFLRFDKR
ncbi:MAG: domain containing protein [Fibrobacteres bacterium]|nr:domain containing protein [Fibrobacterota bacterium]